MKEVMIKAMADPKVVLSILVCYVNINSNNCGSGIWFRKEQYEDGRRRKENVKSNEQVFFLNSQRHTTPQTQRSDTWHFQIYGAAPTRCQPPAKTNFRIMN